MRRTTGSDGDHTTVDNDPTKHSRPILLAEDNRDDEELFRRALPKTGYQTSGQSKTHALSRYYD